MRPLRGFHPCAVVQTRASLTLMAGAILSLMTLCAGRVQAQTYTFRSLLNFNGGNGVLAGLTIDAYGNLFGTTSSGGANNDGTVFELTPAGNGTYNYSDLLDFNGTNGKEYYSTNLAIDSHGNLYGTTELGGTSNYGTVFELTPAGNGSYNYSKLLDFDGLNGFNPVAGLTIDGQGNLYGTTFGGSGGTNSAGTVFKLTPTGNGNYSYSDLLAFNGTNGISGLNPSGDLVIDTQGNLYGTTTHGTNNSGTVYKLAPASNGSYTYSDLFDFNPSTTGYYPYAGLTIDAQGNLYGTTTTGGNGGGTAYELTPTGNGNYDYSDLLNFGDSSIGSNAALPSTGLTIDSRGNLYGTTTFGGAGGSGTAYELTPTGNGTYDYSNLLDFNGTNGSYPATGLTLDTQGNLFGTTGAFGDGTVFELQLDSTGASSTPEPGTWALLGGLYASGAAFYRRRRRK